MNKPSWKLEGLKLSNKFKKVKGKMKCIETAQLEFIGAETLFAKRKTRGKWKEYYQEFTEAETFC